MNQRGIAHLAIIFTVIILIFVGAYLLNKQLFPKNVQTDITNNELVPNENSVSSTSNESSPLKVATESKQDNWKTYEDDQVKLEYPESWKIRLDSGKIGKIKVVSIHDPSTMEWGYTHTQQSGAHIPTKFVNFHSYDTGTNEIYQTVDNYLDYSSHFYDGRGAKEKYSSNGIDYGFYFIGNSQANFIVIANGKSLTGAIAKKTFETLVAEGFDTDNEEIGIIKSVRLK